MRFRMMVVLASVILCLGIADVAGRQTSDRNRWILEGQSLIASATDTSANLKVVADLINGGDARILVFGDSQMAPSDLARMPSGMHRSFAPPQGWSGRAQLYGPGGGNVAMGMWYQGTSPIVSDVINLTLNNLNPYSGVGGGEQLTSDGSGDIVLQLRATEFVSTGNSTDDTDFSQGGFWRGNTPTNWPYGGSEPNWPNDYDINHRLIYYTGNVPAVDLQMKGGRFNEGSGLKGHGAYSAMGITSLGFGQKTVTIPITETVTGAPIVTIKTGTGTDVSGDQVLFQSQMIAATDGGTRSTNFGMKEGLAFCGFIGEGGEDMLNHLDAAKYGDAALEAMIQYSFTPNIVMIFISNIDATEVTGVNGLDTGDGSTYNADLESLIARIKARYAAVSLPDPLFLLVQSWAGHITNSAMNVTRAALTEVEIFDVANNTARAKHSFLNMFTLTGRIHDTTLVQPTSVHPADEAGANSLASLMWNEIVSKSDTGLLRGLTAYWKFNELDKNDTHVDEMGWHDLEQQAGTLGNASAPTPISGKIPCEGGLLYANDADVHFVALNAAAPNHGQFLQPLPGGDFSFQMWLKPEKFNADTQGFFVGDVDTLQSYRLSLWGGDNKLRFSVGDGVAKSMTVPTVLTMDGTVWYHIVCVHKHGVGQFLYLDNVKHTSGTPFAGQVAASSDRLSFGGTAGGSNMQGVIAHPAFWQRALTDAEVTQLYNDGKGLPFSQFGGMGNSTDCNGNGTPDGCDLISGVSQDVNGNGVPDECDCLADVAPVIPGGANGNGVVNIDDLVAVLNAFGTTTPPGDPTSIGDINFNGVVNIDDLVAVLNGFGGCP